MESRQTKNQAAFETWVFRFLFVALSYALAAKLGLIGPYKESIATLLWLPSGIATAAILRWGRVALPAVFFAAWYVEASLGISLLSAAIIAIGNTIAPAFTAALLKKFKFNQSLISQRDIVLMILIAPLGMLVSSLVGAFTLYASGLAQAGSLMKIWFIWWMGDSIGVLLAMPLVLNISRKKLMMHPEQNIQLLVWIILFACCEFLIVNSVDDLNKQFFLTAFLILPVLIWASMTFGVVGGSIVVISLCSIAVWLTAQGYGTFYSVDIGEGLFSLWTFMVTLVITMLLIAMMQAQRNLAARLLEENDKKLRAVIDGALDAILTIDDHGNLVEFNSAAERMFGYKKEQVLGKELAEVIVPPNMREAHRHGHRNYVQTGEKNIFNRRVEMNAMRSDGSEFPIELTLTSINEGGLSLVTGFIRDISEQKKARQEIENFAYYDILTGLPNRRLLVDRFQHAALISRRTHYYCALIFIDLDEFKLLNDTKGHDIGDQLLVEVAVRIQQTLRSGDTVARLSGDEFVVILEGLSEDVNLAYQQTSEVAEKLLEKLNLTYHLGLFEFNTSASLGITLFKDVELDSFELHLRHADAAMYQSKAAGRNTYRFYDEFTQEGIEKKQAMEAALSAAIKNKELELNYQGIVNAEQEIVAAEVLLRWVNPHFGEVNPKEFISIAEKNNQIIKIGKWVLEQACAQIKAWADHPQLSKIQLSVNISAKQF